MASGCGFYVLVVRGFSVEMGGLRLVDAEVGCCKEGGGWLGLREEGGG